MALRFTIAGARLRKKNLWKQSGHLHDFTAQHYRSAMQSMALCLSVSPSVDVLSKWLNTASCKLCCMMASVGTQVFWCHRCWWNSNEVTPVGGPKHVGQDRNNLQLLTTHCIWKMVHG